MRGMSGVTEIFGSFSHFVFSIIIFHNDSLSLSLFFHSLLHFFQLKRFPTHLSPGQTRGLCVLGECWECWESAGSRESTKPANTMLARDIGGSILLYFGATLASAAGIGGGGLNLPILVVIFGFGFSKAAVLSLWTVLGNILAQFSLNYNARHPEKLSRPLIYWDVVLVLLPAQLGGASIGVLLSDVFPQTCLVILAMIILLYAGIKTLFKGIDKWKKETLKLSEKQVITTPLVESDSSKTDDVELLIQQELDGRLSELIQHTPLEVPWAEIRALVGLWIVNASLLIGMNQFGDCSLEKYLFLGATYPVLISFCVGGFYYVSNHQKQFPATVLPSDLNWAEVGFSVSVTL